MSSDDQGEPQRPTQTQSSGLFLTQPNNFGSPSQEYHYTELQNDQGHNQSDESAYSPDDDEEPGESSVGSSEDGVSSGLKGGNGSGSRGVVAWKSSQKLPAVSSDNDVTAESGTGRGRKGKAASNTSRKLPAGASERYVSSGSEDGRGRSGKAALKSSRNVSAGESPTESAGDHGRKRKAKSRDSARPLKKIKGPFNRGYLDLLNDDIEDAASQYVPIGAYKNDERIGLPQSQIGMTVWMPAEKERFFEALGRLGRDDVAGIASRIRTKGEMEVRQYLKLLHHGSMLRRQHNELERPLELADFPAAIELSQECCQALEEAADSIAVRQEHYEDSVEERKFRGGQDWLITQDNCQDVVAEDEKMEGVEKEAAEVLFSEPLNLFNSSMWLQLSERVFMNGPREEENWQSVSGDLPSIRTTTLEDFHSLSVSLTKRLMAASMFMANSRIRSKRAMRPNTRELVKRSDVEAAAATLGLEGGSRSVWWTASARRLGLHVYENPPTAKGQDEEPMSYDDVEDALQESDGPKSFNRIRELARMSLNSDDSDSISSDSPMESDDEQDGANTAANSQAESGDESWDDEVKDEADEIIVHSAAVDQPQTTRERRALMRRIKAEREREKHAEAVDAQESYREEIQMWALLGRQPEEALVGPGSPDSGRRAKITVKAMYSAGKDWRANFKYASEWETTLV